MTAIRDVSQPQQAESSSAASASSAATAIASADEWYLKQKVEQVQEFVIQWFTRTRQGYLDSFPHNERAVDQVTKAKHCWRELMKVKPSIVEDILKRADIYDLYTETVSLNDQKIETMLSKIGRPYTSEEPPPEKELSIPGLTIAYLIRTGLVFQVCRDWLVERKAWQAIMPKVFLYVNHELHAPQD